MASLKRVVLNDLSHLLPMPDRGFRLFPQDESGVVVDIETTFWRKCLRDKSIGLHAGPDLEKPDPEKPVRDLKKRKPKSGDTD